jgi:hypothetical protein
MVSVKRWIFLLMCVCTVCAIAEPNPRMTEREVVAVGMRAIAAKFRWSVGKHYPYAAYYRSDGTWRVGVPHLDDPHLLGGGEPNAEVRDRDGKVLKVYLAR